MLALRITTALVLLSTGSYASGEDTGPKPANADAEDDFEWLVVPNLETSTDRGIGGGVLGIFYWYGDGVKPYRHRIEIGSVVTSKLFQNHYVIWERLGLAAGRVRFRLKLGFRAIQDQTFCGIGNEVTCDPEEARARAADNGLAPSDDGYEDFVARYFLMRLMRPYADASLRYRLLEDLEASLAWSGSLVVSGFFGEDGPYPGSLYAESFPSGEEELIQVLEAGLLFDTRDNEIHPARGQILGAYGRAGFAISGDPRAFTGASLLYGRFDSITTDDLVLANRVILDVQGGDVPTLELARVGSLWDTSAFGGGFGRGVRANRFIGKVKLVGQTELRWQSAPVYRRARILANLFFDAGWIAASVRRSGGDPTRVLYSGGIGPGLSWGRSFVARLDVGFSRYESFSPFFYLRINHPF